MLIPALAIVCAMAVFGDAQRTHAQPGIPATFYGTASIDGQMVPDGTPVRGFIDGKDCTQPPPPDRPGTMRDGGVSAYVIDVMHESQEPGCAADGRTVTFTVGGRQANETAIWKAGEQHLDLNAGSGQPQPLPTATTAAAGTTATAANATDTAKFTPRPAGTLPTDDVSLVSTPHLPASTSVEEPKPDSGGGPSALSILLGLVLILGVAGAGAGIALSRRSGGGNGEDP